MKEFPSRRRTTTAAMSREPRRAIFITRFRLLPEAKRDALCALYAFMRVVDDISDEPGELAVKQHGLARSAR